MIYIKLLVSWIIYNNPKSKSLHKRKIINLSGYTLGVGVGRVAGLLG